MMRRFQRPSPGYYATDAQLQYLRSLLNKAFAQRVTHGLCLDPHHLSPRMTKADASSAIDTLKKLLDSTNK